MKRSVKAHCAVFKDSLVIMANIKPHEIPGKTMTVTITYDDGLKPKRAKAK